MKTAGLVIAVLLALFATSMLVAWMAGWSLDQGMDDDRGPRLVSLAAIAALAGAGVLASMRQKLSTTLLSLIAWGGIFLLVILGYSYRDDATRLWSRIRGELFAGEAVVIDPQTVQVSRAADSHFYAGAEGNGEAVQFMVDTGATMIALSWEDARAAGIDPEKLRFDQRVDTASGPAMVAAAQIGRLSIGPIQRRNLAATILPEGVGISLLGLSFLNTLSSYEVSGDRLTLRD